MSNFDELTEDQKLDLSVKKRELEGKREYKKAIDDEQLCKKRC